MSTLNEIAANHARMAKALEEASVEASKRTPQIVGSFVVPSSEPETNVALHLIAGVQNGQPGMVAGCSI